ncbi:O-antigen ligase family protein [Rhodococcus globerulus]|uniref:O-antigen ligase family protein n=1 Tax=Rhodococcus globerulus TaxID=33008 RepID=UPI001C58CC11|nr:O-antigen ligase family protein [Rhodococcus globerulus]QXW04679.1 O-antigen ligase family protein [Rhodococcus globerulus]
MGKETLELLSSTRGAILMTAAAALFVWFTLPRKADALPRRIVLFIGAFTFGSLIGTNFGLIIQILALVGAFAEWIATPKALRRGGVVVGWAAAVIGFWALLMFHPNVPDFNTALLGFRKTVLAFAGLALGCAMRPQWIPKLEILIIRFTAAAVAVSIASNFFFPALSSSILRAAGRYTAVYEGQDRLQGIYAGPFHAAAAGLLLVGWAIVRWNLHRRTAIIVGTLGMVCMYFTYVRSAYVTLGLMILVALLMAPHLKVVTRRFAWAGMIALVGYVALVWSGDEAVLGTVGSISEFSTDNRFLDRIPSWEEAFTLFNDSIFYGWGAGSAGDTMSDAFVGGVHVTPHNMLLKFAVEGGLIGLLLIAGLVGAVVRRIDRTSDQARLGAVSAMVIIGMGLTISSIDMLPITYFAMVLLGLGLIEKRQAKSDKKKARNHSVHGGGDLVVAMGLP